jgi:hypothetical protein
MDGPRNVAMAMTAVGSQAKIRTPTHRLASSSAALRDAMVIQ